jgi:hypothetical protein
MGENRSPAASTEKWSASTESRSTRINPSQYIILSTPIPTTKIAFIGKCQLVVLLENK